MVVAKSIDTDKCPLSIESLQELVKKNKGIFTTNEIQWAWGLSNNNQNQLNTQWISTSMEITPKGELLSQKVTLINSLQSCSLKLYNHLIIQITSIGNNENESRKLLIKSKSLSEYQDLLSCLLVWSRLRSHGLLNKWNFVNSIADKKKLDELLICRFKVYGPILTNQKIVKFNEFPKCPIYPMSDNEKQNSNVTEGWFTAMGYLRPDGKLDLLRESDGAKIYQINISKLFNFEIKELNNSLFQNSNILFLGFINDIRKSYQNSNEASLVDPTNNLISADGPSAAATNSSKLKCSRILLQFDLRIDLEDWLVTMKSFAKREFLGNNLLSQKLRMHKTCKVEIIECVIKKQPQEQLVQQQHEQQQQQQHQPQFLYAELIMWNAPWCRTSIVQSYNGNCFWKENWFLELPSLTDYFKIVIRSSKNKTDYNSSDPVVGTVFVTPDMIGKGSNDEKDGIIELSNFKVSVYGNKNEEIGNIMINLKMNETHILLPFTNYKLFERMLINTPIDQVIKFIQPLINSTNLQEYSDMLLDIYQTLNMEHNFFTELSKIELIPIDSMVRNNRIKQIGSTSTAPNTNNNNNGLNTIFRGNSILSKSLEKYALRVGQEYLEKLLKDFVSQIANDDLNCEVDPRFIDVEDPHEKKLTLEKNMRNLTYYIKTLWSRIYTTSNDLPGQLKEEWSKLRTQVELSVEPNDTETPLNALTSFIFLRFLCPAILNPKLFYLSKDHQSLKSSRTLTLLAKILMTLSNRSEFPKHKEIYLLPLNEFINSHKDELLIYLDRVTNRKMDFNERILEMSDKIDRPSLNLPIEIVNELPTMPYLIDKYFRIVQFIKILDSNNKNKDDIKFTNNRNIRITNEDNLKLSLEFEILNFDDTDFGSEEFLKNLLKSGSSNNIHDQLTPSTSSQVYGDLEGSYDDAEESLSVDDRKEEEEEEEGDKRIDEEVINSMKTEIKLKELMDQSSVLMKKTNSWENSMIKTEIPTIFALESWNLFIDDLFKRLVTDSSSNVLFLSDLTRSEYNRSHFVNFNESLVLIYKTSVSLTSNMPINDHRQQISKSESLHSLMNADIKSSKTTKNPFKRIFGKKNR